MQQRRVRRVAFVHLSFRVDPVIAYRFVDFVAVEVEARLIDLMFAERNRGGDVVDNRCGVRNLSCIDGTLRAHRVL
jgi:hypothetical protein